MSDPQADQPQAPKQQNPFLRDAPKSNSSALPWVLLGVMSMIAALLAGLLIAQSGELSRLRAESSDAPTSATAPSTTEATTPADSIPQPVTDPDGVEILDSLPRRVAGDPLAMGEVDAPVVLIIWSDFRCPFCSQWERETLPQLLPYVESGSVRIEHRDLVLFEEQSQRTAVAARAAGEQGKFWEFSAAVAAAAPTSGHPDIDDAALVAFAEEAGVADIAQFQKDLDSAELDKAVTDDTTLGQGIGLTSTPFFVVNRTPISGAQPLNVFEQVIESNGGTK